MHIKIPCESNNSDCGKVIKFRFYSFLLVGQQVKIENSGGLSASHTAHNLAMPNIW